MLRSNEKKSNYYNRQNKDTGFTTGSTTYNRRQSNSEQAAKVEERLKALRQPPKNYPKNSERHYIENITTSTRKPITKTGVQNSRRNDQIQLKDVPRTEISKTKKE